MKQRRNGSRSSAAAQPSAALGPPSTDLRHNPANSGNLPILSATAFSLIIIILFYSNRTDEQSNFSHPRSLLELHSSTHLPSCSAYRLSLNDVSHPPASDKPTIYTDWHVDDRGLDTTASFIKRFGHIPQYIKMGDALPLYDKARKVCTAPFGVLIDILTRKFIKNGHNNIMNGMPKKRATINDMLIFTNDNESPELFDVILKQYKTPDPLSFADTHDSSSEKSWLKIFSVMMQRSAHRFHVHDEAWLGQVAGSRMWFLLPPSTPSSALDQKPPACEYLYNRETLPQNAMVCVQNPGDVMYLPKGWWHGTCGLEEWNVGVGGQLGAPSMPIPRVSEVRTEEEWDEKLEECQKGGAYGG